jgi:hypothetical protein
MHQPARPLKLEKCELRLREYANTRARELRERANTATIQLRQQGFL